MNLKEFDAKQFLLEKGERVGLGIALTLMVLMLIFSLFLPSKGFFSGSPAEKTKVLADATQRLDRDLKSKPIPDSERPEPTEGRLIGFDRSRLNPSNYTILTVFESAIKESPARRPPRIYNIDEGVVAVRAVPIDTYLFSPDFSKVYVLTEKDRPGAAGTGGSNPFGTAYGPRGSGMAPPGMAPPGMNAQMLQQNRRRLNNGFLKGADNLYALSGNDVEYEVKPIDVKEWNPQMLTARQPRPLRLAVIGGSFPYKAQLDEFRTQLRLPNISAVLNETLPDKEGESFKFLGVEIQRKELDLDGKPLVDAAGKPLLDAEGKPLSEWKGLELAASYQMWLKSTFLPFQPENPRYNLVKMDGLVAPLLREFHPNRKVDPTMRTRGMMMPPGMPQPAGRPGGDDVEADDVKKTSYPDVVAELPKLVDTLNKLGNVQQALIAAPKTTADNAPFDPFRPFAAPLADNPDARKDPELSGAGAATDLAIPEHVLMRLVDVNLEPGRSYHYRVRIKMNNPNYKRADVASPGYKIDKELKSKQWYEIKQAALVPSELKYYVVDEKQAAPKEEQKEVLRRGNPSAQARQWAARGPSADQVVFQLHRWVESVALSRKESDRVPLGQWAVADRVVVSRGEYVGRKVRVDLPIWKYSKNGYVLPIDENQKKSRNPNRQTPTGIDVDFGFDSSTLDTILVDFEGGRVSAPAPSKVVDTCRTEVLMLAPDGKLLARNSAKDAPDEDRKERREKVLQRIEEIRAGKVAE